MLGTEQVFSAYSGTVHHRLIYGLQNHALNLLHETFLRDYLLIAAEREDIPI